MLSITYSLFNYSYSDLVKKLIEVRAANGSIDEIGEILLKWVCCLFKFMFSYVYYPQ